MTDDSPTAAAPPPDPAATAPDAAAFTPSSRPADDADALPPAVGRFRFEAEVARGGMGVVYRAEDATLGREVAVKVLAADLFGSPLAVARFASEVRITGRLQHPGIPPVFEVGHLPDGRPFLAMKLIKGQTLADILTAKTRDRADLIPAFEQICQAVGYAHSRGVIHRDLKPANVMVGAFGEVQVMDWGLAKEMRNAERGTRNENEESSDSEFRAPNSALTQAGSVMGTPAYMAPEQADGRTDTLDPRADVFGLGAILCVLLTGHPPYTGDSADIVRRQAAKAELTDAFARLDACGAEPKLVSLCRRCLAVYPDARPADAGEVALAVQRIRAGAAVRDRRAEADEAAAEIRRDEATKRRRMERGVMVGGAVAAVALAGVLGLLLWQAVAHERELVRSAAVQVQAEREKVTARHALDALPDLTARFRWADADKLLASATDGGDLALRKQLDQARSDLTVARLLDAARLDAVRRGGAAAALFDAPLAMCGIDLVREPVEVSASKVKGEKAIFDHLIGALDQWAVTEADADTRFRLFAVTASATGHGWRDKFADVFTDRAKLAALYASVPPAERSAPLSVHVRTGIDAELSRRPADFWLHFGHAATLDRAGEKEKSVAAYRAAAAVRPEVAR